MSDFHSVKEKVKEGAEWRGTIRVNIDDEEHELTIRQLRDPEFEEVMSLIDRNELDELQDELPQEAHDEYTDLSQKEEELTEEESERLAELEETLEEESPDMFDILSSSTFDGIRRCGKYCVEPDEEDLEQAFRERAGEIEREYGVKVKTPEDVKPALQDDIEYMIDNAVDFTSFTIGIQCLVETVGEDEGN